MRNDESTPYIPKFDTSEWRVGFEIEMLFGDLGLKRYRQVSEQEGGYDVAPVSYCEDIAKRLTKLTGEKWAGSEKPEGKGFFVVPEPDLDPLSFSHDTVGGVELITPPLLISEAEELRRNIIAAVQDMKNGYSCNWDEDQSGWHVNVDKGVNDRNIDAELTCAGLWESGESEVDILLETSRYGSGHRYSAPQHHAYGPALLMALHSQPFPLREDELNGFLFHHCGRSKRFALNFGKLERDYVELRHLSLAQFMETDVNVTDYLNSIFKAMTIAPSNSRIYLDRLLERFTLLGEWLQPLQSRFSIQTRDKSMVSGREARVLFDGGEIARISWNGVGELRFGSLEDELRDKEEGLLSMPVYPELSTGLDADELLAGVAVLAMDSLYFEHNDTELPTMPGAFLEEVSALGESFEAEGMISGIFASHLD